MSASAARRPLASATQAALAWAGQTIRFWHLFTRFPVMGATALLPLIGAATVVPRLAAGQVLALLAVAVAFHTFAYVLNDVIDLPVDRTEPLRAECPLVRGTVQPRPALFFALLQAPFAFGLTAWHAGAWPAYAALAASFCLIAVYDLWGKRIRFPPLTDAVQGLGWGAFVLYGAAMAPGHWTHLTALVFAFVVAFIVLINGVHGGLRDLGNDLRCGMRSTAILLGARPQGDGLTMPRRLALYALGWQAVLCVLLLAALAYNDFGYAPAARAATLIGVLSLALAALFWLRVGARSAGDRSTMIMAGALHVTIMLGCLIALFALYLDGRLLLLMLGVYLIPWLTHTEVMAGPLRAARQLLSAARPRP